MAYECCTSVPCDAWQLIDLADWKQDWYCTVCLLPSRRSLLQRGKCCIALPIPTKRERFHCLRWFQLHRWMPWRILRNRSRNLRVVRSLGGWIWQRLFLPHPSNDSMSRCDWISREVESKILWVLRKTIRILPKFNGMKKLKICFSYFECQKLPLWILSWLLVIHAVRRFKWNWFEC